MIAKAEIILKNNDNLNLNYHCGSIFHGYIMDIVDYDYANFLHSSNLKPFSQNITKKDNQIIWTINTLNEESFEKILVPLLKDNIQSIFLKQKKNICIIEKKEIIYESSYNDFTKKYYLAERLSKYIKCKFETPTSFKSYNNYLIFPDLQLMYNSLMKKYDANTNCFSIYDKEVLQELVICSKIIEYKLKSSEFCLEKTKIHSFSGEITIEINGNNTIKSLFYMLLHFGNFAGVGTKTALGMGKFSV